MRVKHFACAMVALAFCGSGAMAQDAPRQVEVKGLKDPQMHAYRSVWAGLDAFDKHRALAPRADPVRFRIQPYPANKAGAMDGITLHIVGKGDAIEVPIVDGQFTIALNQAAYDDKADLMFNHKRNLFKTFAEVRTPGVPSGARRLGDLRLECQVDVAIIKTEIPFHINVMLNAVFAGSNWCEKVGLYLSIPVAGLGKATLAHGARRKDFPLADISDGIKISALEWPDDTLLELDYATLDSN